MGEVDELDLGRASVGAEDVRLDVVGVDPRLLLREAVATPQVRPLGELMLRTDIRSSLGPFQVLPGYQTVYPTVVTQALGNLYTEYNQAFAPLREANREGADDYRFMNSVTGAPVNYFVQIDMVGLPDEFLQTAAHLPEAQVREALRGSIFEIENSLAVYQLLNRVFDYGEGSKFNQEFRSSLNELREHLGRPIALLAVTEPKHQAMRESEFGKNAGEELTDAEVCELSGFDKFFGPEEFKQHLAENGGDCGYALYVRSSDPVSKLKKPGLHVENPILDDPLLRSIVKAHSITMNIDAPGMPEPQRINDSKEYLPTLGMAYAIASDQSLFSVPLQRHMAEGKAYADYQGVDRLHPDFAAFLMNAGVDAAQIGAGGGTLRLKPMKASYGCYGHLHGELGDKRMRQELRRNQKERGAYVVQPELATPILIDEATGQRYTFIDRNFMSFTNGQPKFLGGFRSLMPLDSVEAQSGRVHGSNSTVWAEIR